MDKRDFNNLGDQIKNTVQDAVDSMNFERLNQDISNSVRNALDDVNSRLRGYQDPNRWIQNHNRFRDRGNHRYNNTYDQREKSRYRQDDSSYRRKRAYGSNDSSYGRNNRSYNSKERTNDRNHYSNKNDGLKPMFNNVPGRVSGVLLQVFGYLGSSIFGIAVFVLAILYVALDYSNVFRIISIALSPLFLASVFMIIKGTAISKRLKRYKQYTIRLQNQSYCLIKELAVSVGKTERYVAKDLRKMIGIGMFPQGHIDEQNTCFMSNDETYQQYLQTISEYKKRQQEEVNTSSDSKKDSKSKQENAGDQKSDKAVNEDLRKTIDEGKMYIQRIKEANDAIPGEEISNKLYRLEEVISKIFLCVEQHPEQLPELKKFMEYYLPTTLKLVSAYQEFDAQPIQGENITTAKNEIGKTLETINFAFENLLDSLYQDAAMEVSTDITVLESLLAREGLTDKDFKITKGGNKNE